jgi:hypothetical protein
MNLLARLAATIAFSLTLFAIGCSSQTEGQRCDVPSDCQDGLECRSVVNQTSMVCCPTNGASTVASCNPGPPRPVDTDAKIDADADADAAATDESEGASSDSPAETATPDDAAADTANEATADAAVE